MSIEFKLQIAMRFARILTGNDPEIVEKIRKQVEEFLGSNSGLEDLPQGGPPVEDIDEEHRDEAIQAMQEIENTWGNPEPFLDIHHSHCFV